MGTGGLAGGAGGGGWAGILSTGRPAGSGCSCLIEGCRCEMLDVRLGFLLGALVEGVEGKACGGGCEG